METAQEHQMPYIKIQQHTILVRKNIKINLVYTSAAVPAVGANVVVPLTRVDAGLRETFAAILAARNAVIHRRRRGLVMAVAHHKQRT